MFSYRWANAKHGGIEKAQSIQRDTYLSRGQRVEEVAIIGTYSSFLDNLPDIVHDSVVFASGWLCIRRMRGVARSVEVVFKKERGAFATLEVLSMDGIYLTQASTSVILRIADLTTS